MVLNCIVFQTCTDKVKMHMEKEYQDRRDVSTTVQSACEESVLFQKSNTLESEISDFFSHWNILVALSVNRPV